MRRQQTQQQTQPSAPRFALVISCSEVSHEVPPRRYGDRLGLRAQILIGLASVTLLAIVTTGFLSLWAAASALRLDRETEATVLASAAARVASAIIDRQGDLASVETRAQLTLALTSLSEHSDRVGFSVVIPGKEVVAAWPPRFPGDRDPPLINSITAGIAPVLHYRDPPEGGEKQLLAYAGVEHRGRTVAAARAVLLAPAPVMTVLRRSGWVLLGLVCGDAILVLALGYFVLTQMVVRPLRLMEKATAQVSAGDWDHHIVLTGPSELRALAQAFNNMTSSLVAQREQLIRTEKLASIGQLAAGIAHEIGNPLAAILGYVDILRSEAAGAGLLPEADRRDALDRVKTETQRINRIIRDLLEYSRPSHEDPAAIDPLKVVRSAQALLVPQARFREIRLTVTPLREAWPKVMAAPSRMTQVLVNLLLNAADAMGGKGSVTVSCASVEDRIHIAVSDEGPGIARELHRKVFDPFFTTKAPGQGTGLGLSISRSIVESYGGTLELDPTAEKGARFIIVLPAESHPEARPVQA